MTTQKNTTKIQSLAIGGILIAYAALFAGMALVFGIQAASAQTVRADVRFNTVQFSRSGDLTVKLDIQLNNTASWVQGDAYALWEVVEADQSCDQYGGTPRWLMGDEDGRYTKTFGGDEYDIVNDNRGKRFCLQVEDARYGGDAGVIIPGISDTPQTPQNPRTPQNPGQPSLQRPTLILTAGDTLTPTFTVTVDSRNTSGTVELFGNGGCFGTSIGSENVSSTTVAITTSPLTSGQSYIVHAKHAVGGRSKCSSAGVVYQYTAPPQDPQNPGQPNLQKPTLILTAGNTLTPTFTVTVDTNYQNGTVELFDGRGCSTSISNAKAFTSDTTVDVTTTTLTSGQSYTVYAKHTVGSRSECSSAGVTYQYTTPPQTPQDPQNPGQPSLQKPTLALSSPTTSPYTDSTPTFTVTVDTNYQNGTVQLFGDSTCSTAISASEAVSSTTVPVTTTTLTSGQQYTVYAKHTTGSRDACSSDRVDYTYNETPDNGDNGDNGNNGNDGNNGNNGNNGNDGNNGNNGNNGNDGSNNGSSDGTKKKKKRGGCGGCGGGFYIPLSTPANTAYASDATLTAYIAALKQEVIMLMERLVNILTDRVDTLIATRHGGPAQHLPTPAQTLLYPVPSRLKRRITSL